MTPLIQAAQNAVDFLRACEWNDRTSETDASNLAEALQQEITEHEIGAVLDRGAPYTPRSASSVVAPERQETPVGRCQRCGVVYDRIWGTCVNTVIKGGRLGSCGGQIAHAASVSDPFAGLRARLEDHARHIRSELDDKDSPPESLHEAYLSDLELILREAAAALDPTRERKG